MRLLFAVMLGLGFYIPHAQAQRRIHIHSRYDDFELVLNTKGGQVAGKTADLSTFRPLLRLLTDKPGNTCPSLTGSPDITVTESGHTRKIFVSKGVVTDGSECLGVGGDGIYYFPAHRDFLIGPKSAGIQLKSPLKIFSQGRKVLDLKKSRGDWSTSPETLPNWNFIERFENSLKHFEIQARVQEGIEKGKPKMLIQSGDTSLTFYKISGSTWAAKLPGQNWLVTSNAWTFWYDFDKSVIEDPLAEAIRMAGDAHQKKADRIAALQKVSTSWSPNLRELYHRILLAPSEDADVQTAALKRLRLKPSTSSAQILARFIHQTSNNQLKQMAVRTLHLWKKVRH